jgi:hypothetical protein
MEPSFDTTAPNQDRRRSGVFSMMRIDGPSGRRVRCKRPSRDELAELPTRTAIAVLRRCISGSVRSTGNE